MGDGMSGSYSGRFQFASNQAAQNGGAGPGDVLWRLLGVVVEVDMAAL